MSDFTSLLNFGSVATGVAGAIEKGQALNDAAILKRDQLDIEGKVITMNTLAAERQRWEQLASTVAAQKSLMTARGIDLESGTAQNIEDETRLKFRQDFDLLWANTNARQDVLAKQRGVLDRQGEAALQQSYFEAAGLTLSGMARGGGLIDSVAGVIDVGTRAITTGGSVVSDVVDTVGGWIDDVIGWF